MGIETLAIGSLVAGVASTGISAMGAANTAKANSQSAQYAAAVARNNAIIADNNAKYALAVGDVQGEAQQMKTKALVGQQKAAQAANGIDVNKGTAVDVRASTEELGHLDALTILNDAANKAAGYRAQGAGFTAEAGLDTMKADQALTAGTYAVAGSLAGGAASTSDKWATYKQNGVFA